MNDHFWFAIFPYIAVAVFVLGMAFRLVKGKRGGGGSNRFWGARLFHWVLLVVLLLHLLCIFMPDTVLDLNMSATRQLVIEGTGLGFAIFLLVGLLGAMFTRVRKATGTADIGPLAKLFYLLMVVEVLTGIAMVMVLGNGTSWFATSVSPWFMSLLTFSPDTYVISAMPPCVKIHLILAFVILLLIPFTRLTNLLLCPGFAPASGATEKPAQA